MHILYKLCNILLFFLAPLTRKIDPNSDFDRIWKEIVDETLEDNTEEEIIRYLCGEQQ